MAFRQLYCGRDSNAGHRVASSDELLSLSIFVYIDIFLFLITLYGLKENRRKHFFQQ
jgi:hypothetical protein